jgi:hypothetical protein
MADYPDLGAGPSSPSTGAAALDRGHLPGTARLQRISHSQEPGAPPVHFNAFCQSWPPAALPRALARAVSPLLPSHVCTGDIDAAVQDPQVPRRETTSPPPPRARPRRPLPLATSV